LIDGLQVIDFSPPRHLSYKASGFCLGGTVSHWTRQPSLDARTSKIGTEELSTDEHR